MIPKVNWAQRSSTEILSQIKRLDSLLQTFPDTDYQVYNKRTDTYDEYGRAVIIQKMILLGDYSYDKFTSSFDLFIEDRAMDVHRWMLGENINLISKYKKL
jgi:hypothetical protein